MGLFFLLVDLYEVGLLPNRLTVLFVPIYSNLDLVQYMYVPMNPLCKVECLSVPIYPYVKSNICLCL